MKTKSNKLSCLTICLILSSFLLYNCSSNNEEFQENKSQESLINHHSKPKPKIEYAPGEILIKFKEGADKGKAINSALSKPLEILRDPKTGKSIKSESKEYKALLQSKSKLKNYNKEQITLDLKEDKKVFQEKLNLKAKEAGFNSWHKIKITAKETDERDVDVYHMIRRLRSNPNIEFAEPNFKFKAQYVPNDPYFHSSGSWGQDYDDMWNLKEINIEKAYEVIYAKRGDLDRDGDIDFSDYKMLKKIVTTMMITDLQEVADLNGDDLVNMDDLDFMFRILTSHSSLKPVDFSKNEVVIAVSDSGVAYDHEDIQNSLWENPGEIPNNNIDDDGNGYTDDVMGWDFTGENWMEPFLPYDAFGHGTHVAGTIAATSDNDTGIAGVCPHCKIMIVKGLDMEGYGYADDLSNTLFYAAQNGADVINMSWGGTASSRLLEYAVNYAHSLGIVLVTSAGNYNDRSEFFAPARYANVITVASLDHNNIRSGWSNFGKIDVSAPGGDTGWINQYAEPPPFFGRNILSLRTQDMYGDGYSYVGDDNNYYRAKGTSMAAPHVSGLAGLILARHPEFSNEQVRSTLIQSATDLIHETFDCEAYSSDEATCNAANETCYFTFEYSVEYEEECYNIPDDIVCDSNEHCFWNENTDSCWPGRDYCATWDREYEEGFDNFTGAGKIDAYKALKIQDPLIAQIGMPADGGVFEKDTELEIYGSALGGGFTHYVLKAALKNNPTNWITISEGSRPVENSLLGTFDTQGLFGNYIVRLITLGENNTNVKWEVDVLLGVEQGWPINYDTYDYWIINPLYADFDPDYPGLEIIFTSWDFDDVLGDVTKIFVMHADGSMMDGWPKVLNRHPNDLAGPAVADLEGDGDLELVITPLYGGVYIYNNDGTYVTGWPQYLNNSFAYAIPVIADLDRDGLMEILVATERNELHVFNHDGSNFSDAYPLALGDMWDVWLNTIAVGNLDTDEELEIVVAGGSWGDTLYAINPDGSNLNSAWPMTLDAYDMHPTLADIDGDGIDEIFIHEYHSTHAFDSFGQPLFGNWPISMNYSYLSAIAFGDVDSESQGLEYVTFSNNLDPYPSALYLFNTDGSIHNGWPIHITGTLHPMNPVVVDIDGDGNSEIITKENAKILIFNKDGNSFSDEWPIDINPEKYIAFDNISVPIVGDFDLDNKLELFIFTEGRMLMIEFPGMGAIDWPMYQQNPQRTGRFDTSIVNSKIDSKTKDEIKESNLIK